MITLELDQAYEMHFTEEEKLLVPMRLIPKHPFSKLNDTWLLCFDTMKEYVYVTDRGISSTPIYTYDSVHAIRMNGEITPLGYEVEVYKLFEAHGYDINSIR